MHFADPPTQVAWRHKDLREGFEVVFIEPRWTVEGATTAVEDGEAFAVQYAIDLSPDWVTRSARVASFGREVHLLADGDGAWHVNGEPAPELDGIFDVDLESSSFTNAFPVHRLALEVDESSDAPAAWVRFSTLAVERLEQRYTRLPDDEAGRRASTTGHRTCSASWSTTSPGSCSTTRGSLHAPAHPEEREREQAAGEREEAAGLDRLQRPVAVRGLVGHALAVAEVGEALEAGGIGDRAHPLRVRAHAVTQPRRERARDLAVGADRLVADHPGARRGGPDAHLDHRPDPRRTA